MRTFFDKPLDEIALMYHTREINCQEFVENLMCVLPIFLNNMKNISNFADKEQYAEKWMETFLAWCEFNTNE